MPLTSFSNTTYAEQIISLAAYTGTAQIAFHVPSGGLDGYYLYIDDVNVETIPTCLVPTAVAVSAITQTSASVAWTCTSCVGNYIVEYGTTGFTPGTGATEALVEPSGRDHPLQAALLRSRVCPRQLGTVFTCVNIAPE
ncbi:MAG: hypothetical protein IPL86_11825 [Flavobacteriales bacterium]|nr:hypothetical protein [Flavobacteriales bacterium]